MAECEKNRGRAQPVETPPQREGSGGCKTERKKVQGRTNKVLPGTTACYTPLSSPARNTNELSFPSQPFLRPPGQPPPFSRYLIRPRATLGAEAGDFSILSRGRTHGYSRRIGMLQLMNPDHVLLEWQGVSGGRGSECVLN